MFCTNCGRRVDPSNDFCPYCGIPLDHPAIQNARQAETNAQAAGPATQALPRESQQVQPPVQGRPYTGGSYSRQQSRASRAGEGVRTVARQRQSSATPRYQAASAATARNRALIVAACAVALIAAVVLALVKPFQGFPVGDRPQQTAPAELPSAPSDQAGTPEQGQGVAAGPEAPYPGGPVSHDALPDYSWEELGQIAGLIEECPTRSEAIAVAQAYNLADSSGSPTSATKDVALRDGSVVPVRLVGIWHDEAATSSGRAGLSFLATGIGWRYRMASDKTTDGGWEASELRSWMNADLLAQFPDDLSSQIEPVFKYSNNDGKTTSQNCVTGTTDRLWVPSIVEVCGPVSWTFDSDPANSGYYNAVFNAEGEQYATFTQAGVVSDDDNVVLALGGDWWLRSTAASSGRGRHVSSTGNPSGFGDSDEELGVVVGFCL